MQIGNILNSKKYQMCFFFCPACEILTEAGHVGPVACCPRRAFEMNQVRLVFLYFSPLSFHSHLSFSEDLACAAATNFMTLFYSTGLFFRFLFLLGIAIAFATARHQSFLHQSSLRPVLSCNPPCIRLHEDNDTVACPIAKSC